MKYFSLVWSNLKRKKLRTALTLLSIFVAFVLFGFLSILKEAFTGGISMAGADRLMVQHKVSFIMPLPISYLARMESIPGVVRASHTSWFGGIYKDDTKNVIATFPVDPERYLDLYPEMVLPKEQKQAWLNKRNGAVVGRTTFERFAKTDGWKIGSIIPMKSPIWGQPEGQDNWEFEIVGVYDGAKKGVDTSGFFFRYDYFDEGRALNKGQVGWYNVRVNDPEQATQVAKRIDQEFANSPFETKAATEAAAMQGFASQIGDIGSILMMVVSAVFFTILLVAGNTMSQAVRERTEELGVLKAMGFTNELVLVLVMAESCLIAMLGGFAGLGVAALVAAAGSPVPQMLPMLNFTNRDMMIGVGMVIALGLIAGALPAIQAMRLRIAVALRRNG